jgi:hypothetical protein
VLLSILTLFWQLFVLFACCSGAGLALRFFLPKKFSLLNKVLFSLMGGFFLVVLVPQNLVYLGMPVRISAWLLLGAALVPVWLSRRQLVAWIGTCYANAKMRTLAVVTLLTIIFHGFVPIRQGLSQYYGKAYPDQINYVQQAEFLKEEPYSTSAQDVGLRPWLVSNVGFHLTAGQVGMKSGPGVEVTGLKKERIGQSIINAEMSVWSGTDGEAGYAATVTFYLALLAICLYAFLCETGINHFMAGSGALVAAFLPAVTRLSLDGFLSQVSTLFIFPFFACLLRPSDLSARSFTLFFSLTLAYLVAAYADIAPIGFCTLLLGVMFARQDKFRAKRLMLMGAILLIALMNPYYLRNLIQFLGQQYYTAGHATSMNTSAPNVLSLHGWSELIFGVDNNAPFAFLFDSFVILLGLLFLAGVILLTSRERLIFGAVLLPGVLVIFYLASRTPPSYYPIAKITLTILPFSIGLVFVALSRVAAKRVDRTSALLRNLLSAFIVAAAAAGSVRYYTEVLNNEGLLSAVREPRFLNVCRELEKIKSKRVLVFETSPLLTSWLCYHARHNDAYIDCSFMNDSALTQSFPFAKIPDLENVDFVAARDRIVDLRDPGIAYLTLVDDTPGEDRTSGQVRYWLGPPVRLRFLALRPMSANLKMRFSPGPEATTFPIDYFLADDQGHVSQGEIRGETVDVRPMNFLRGISKLQLSVKAKDSDPNAGPSFPIVAEMDDLKLSDIELNPGE